MIVGNHLPTIINSQKVILFGVVNNVDSGIISGAVFKFFFFVLYATLASGNDIKEEFYRNMSKNNNCIQICPLH